MAQSRSSLGGYILLFVMACAAGLVLLSMLRGAATVQVGPKPTPDGAEEVNIDDMVREAKELIPDLKPGESASLPGGLLKVERTWGGWLSVSVVGSGTPALWALAEQVLERLN